MRWCAIAFWGGIVLSIFFGPWWLVLTAIGWWAYPTHEESMREHIEWLTKDE